MKKESSKTKTPNLWVRTCPECGKIIHYKSYSAWHLATKSNSCCRNCSAKSRTNRSADLSVLLEDCPESFYWIGFLLSDGNFSGNRLTFVLSKKDSEQVHKFGKYINYTGSYGNSKINERVSVQDIDIIPKIKRKFNILDNKTYNPPNSLNKFPEDLYVALIAGFIDGDGNIQNPKGRKDFFLRIKNHSSWLHILQEFNNYIYPEKDCCKINNSGYAELDITNTLPLQRLKNKVLSLNLPILKRKWDIIDLNFISRYITTNKDRQKIIRLYLHGYSVKDICSNLNFKEGKVYKTIRDYEKGYNKHK